MAGSPDGKWLAYQSDESERQEIYVVPFPVGQGRWQISSNGGRLPRWRHDGKALFFLGGDGKVAIVELKQNGSSLEIGNAHPLMAIEAPIVAGPIYDVSSDGQRFLVTQAGNSTTTEPLVLIQNWPAELKK